MCMRVVLTYWLLYHTFFWLSRMEPPLAQQGEMLGRRAGADFGEKRYVGSTDGYRHIPCSLQYPSVSNDSNPSCLPIVPFSPARLFLVFRSPWLGLLVLVYTSQMAQRSSICRISLSSDDRFYVQEG